MPTSCAVRLDQRRNLRQGPQRGGSADRPRRLRRAVAVTDALGHITSTTFDPAGRRVAVQDALRYLVSTVFDEVGNAIAVIDPRGYRTSRS